MELSADRIGYICTHSLEYSVSSMMKTASGLDSSLLNSNIRPFLDQNVPIDDGSYLVQSTHPPLPLRARALVWLSTIKLFDNSGNLVKIDKQNGTELKAINKRIKSDIHKYLDKTIEESFELAKKYFRLTLFTLHLSKNSVLSKKNQQFLIQECGEEARKLFQLMNGMPTNQVQEMLSIKNRDALREMVKCSATQSNKFIDQCAQTIGIPSLEVRQLISNEMASNSR